MVITHELAVKLAEKNRQNNSHWKGLLMYIFFPVAIPILVYQAIRAFRERFGFKKRPLEGKVVLISGASSGIGERLAHQFYLAGCQLILASRKKEELEKVKADLVRLETFGPVYVPAILVLNLEDLDSLPNKANSALEIHGGIDILINNAGKSYRGNILDTDISVDQKLMAVNYFGPLCFTKHIAQSMVQRRSGTIVFMSSIQGKISLPHRSAYSASKHAVQALADCLRAELNETGIEVIVISPSYVKTKLSLNALTASGHTYGQMDSNTENGFSPDLVAQKTLKAVMNHEKEIVIGSTLPRIAIFLRYFYPALFFRLMSNRARK